MYSALFACIFSMTQKAKVLIDSDPEVLNIRGGVGELPIHLCYIYNSKVQLQIADYMVTINPDLLKAVYDGPVFKGENLLHIAIVKKNFKLVKQLMEAVPELIHGRAEGSFFQVLL